MTTIGLVLGAGGLLGSAFHAGALTALDDEIGWDPRTADLIIGTSAGANTAATLRAGLSAPDELARLTGSTPSDEGAQLINRVRTPLHLPPPEQFRPSSRRPGSLRLAVNGLRNKQPTKVLTGLVGRGEVSGASIGARVRQFHPDMWPQQPTWIVAVDLATGDRHVMGRADDRVHISAAVQASSAVPGYLEPVSLGGKQFVDGGIHSSTNADLAAGLFFDLVVVCSPLSIVSTGSRLGQLREVNRSWHAYTLAAEVAKLRAAGSKVLVLQPDAADLSIAGANNMDGSRVRDYARQIRSSIRGVLARPGVEKELELLTAATEEEWTSL